MKKHLEKLALPLLCFFLFCLCIYLMVTRDSTSVKKVDWEELFKDFNGHDSPERTMRFTIDLPDECRLRGEYKGKVFRQIDASKGDLCEEYRYENGKDPDKYTDKMVDDDVVYNIRRKLKQNCREVMDYDVVDDVGSDGDKNTSQLVTICNKKDYCEWDGGNEGECVFDKKFIKNI